MRNASGSTFNQTIHHPQETRNDVVVPEEFVEDGVTLFQRAIEEKQWDDVLEIARSSIGPREARRHTDDWDGCTGRLVLPLTFACEHNAPFHVVKAILDLYPEAIEHKEYPPIIDAARCHKDINVMRLLLEADHQDDGGAKRKWLSIHLPLPLHCLLLHNKHTTLEMIALFLDAYPESVTVPNYERTLPLHMACEMKDNVPDDEQEKIFLALFNAYPEAVQHREKNSGHLPLHSAVSGAVAPVGIIQHLIEAFPSGLQMRDNFGCCPIHLLCTNVSQTGDWMDGGYLELKASEDRLVCSMKVLLQAHPESIIRTACNWRRVTDPNGIEADDWKWDDDKTLYYPREIAQYHFGGQSHAKLLSLMKNY